MPAAADSGGGSAFGGMDDSLTSCQPEFPEKHLITGGGGYVGEHLLKALREKGHKVILFDVIQPNFTYDSSIQFIQGDIRNLDDVLRAAEGVSCIYHVASYGMSGKQMFQQTMTEEININGTKNVIESCRQHGVKRLVYTSTVNVVFNGSIILDGDETMSYLPEDQYIDHYSRTKSIAEQLIRAANCSETSDGGTLYTTVLRSVGIYGPGEQRHFPRIVRYMREGLLVFRCGCKNAISDFVHIENLVQAQILAAEGLKAGKNYISAGQVYNIADGKPINNFEFFRTLIEGLGYPYPWIRLPMFWMYIFVFLSNMFGIIMRTFVDFEPMLNLPELYKVAVTHTFSIKKAQTQLGYQPTKVNDLTGMLQWYLDRGYHKDSPTHGKVRVSTRVWVWKFLVGLLVACVIMAFIPLVS